MNNQIIHLTIIHLNIISTGKSITSDSLISSFCFSAIISLEAILKFFEDQKSLVIEGGAKVDASDIQAFSFDPENQLIVAQVYTTMKDKIYTVMVSWYFVKIICTFA